MVERWQIDSGHSGVRFSVRQMVLAKVRGRFTRWSGRSRADDPAGAKVA
jgi:polyisoprenoid-binding protein YceI